ncbi:MAG: TauD/TfdA family dioxygenase, partial [Alphaproteobacteria bacterium]
MVNIRNGDLRRPAEPMKPVVDPAGWTGAELKASDDWVFRLDAGDIAEIDAAADAVEARGLDIKDISRDDFPLPGLDSKLAQIKTELIDGRGIAVLRGLPVERYDIARSAAAFWGMGLRIGEPVSQNHKGHVLGHVLDLMGDSRDKDPTTRAYNTSSALDYHSDS